ncbi:MAG: sulfotransferase [Acidimicrobiia bacterium]|nr:sulfotransferase [Acidimicrobiia bacterium]MDH4306852.1 sulfotransferase [Acidimicrobiia bacterium]MDH5292852.1 sulfotransferase [Acidimicrobiia bacterium]
MTTKILAIVGSDRSGSTVLDNILGGIPGAFSGGEIRYLWERGIVERRLCGCGEPVAACPVWSRVLSSVPEPSRDAVTVLADLEYLRTRHAFSDTVPVFGSRYRAKVGEIAAKIAPVYHALAAETGAEVIVDSSKRPTWARLLSAMPDVDVSVVHLIRDPRAVSHSRKRFKRQLDSSDEISMRQHPPVVSATFWTVWNLAANRLAGDGYLRVRYEDLMADPVGSVDRIRALAGLDQPHPTLTSTSVELQPSHTVSGNPARFSTGEVALRSDDAWRRDQNGGDRLITDLLTLPLARSYGYGELRQSRNLVGATGPVEQEIE